MGRISGRVSFGLLVFTIAAGFLGLFLFPRHDSSAVGTDRFRPEFGLTGGQRLDYVPVSPPDAGPATSPTPALSSAERVSFGQTIKRTFQSGTNQFLFSFQAQAGDVITVTMAADQNGSLDPALVLLGPDGKPVARNEDSLDPTFGLSNARLVNFPIRSNGMYTIQALRSTQDGGAFTLALRSRSTKSNAAALDYGSTSQGTIRDNTVRVYYQFQAAEGDVISIVVQSLPGSKLVPYVMLLDASGSKLVDSNPVATTARVARITGYPIQSEGTYTVSVGRVGEEAGATAGNYKVTLSLDNGAANASQKAN